MLSKPLLGLSIGFIALMGGYFLLNPSYEKSIESKFYYTIGDYKEAYRLANEAFELNSYNRMASTVMAQSVTALKFVRYIEQSETYLRSISEIADADQISAREKIRIKLMCEIMMDEYLKIAPTVVTDHELVEKVEHYHRQFVGLYEKVTASI